MKTLLDLRLLRAFVFLVETGSVSETARLTNRTQPAVSLQFRRLEEATGTTLLVMKGRRRVLTPDGELLLGYARTLLNLNAEVQARLSAPKLGGKVMLGVPDLYAASLLPPILGDFSAAHPNVEVEICCALSSQLMSRVESEAIDLALVTGMPAFKDGELVAQEPLIWVTGEQSSVHNENPLPLALLPPGNIFRDHGLAALANMGRKWRVPYTSDSLSGLYAAVLAGIAVAVMTESSLASGMRRLGRQESFPPLPKVDLVMYRSRSDNNPAAAAMAEFIVRRFAASSLRPQSLQLHTQAGSGSTDR
jgi:DNA-binding transcriptional LysR family regulator